MTAPEYADDSDVSGAESPLPVGGHMRRAFKWSVLTQIMARAGSMTLGLVLARLLAPAEFGVYTIALSLFTILLTIDDLGIRQGLVRYDGDPDAAGPTAATIALLSGIFWFSVAFVLAPYIAEVTNTPAASGVIRLLCIGLLIDAGLHVVPAAMLHRRFRQDLWLVTEAIAMGVTATVTIVLAVRGFGPHALAWGTIAGQAAMAGSAMVLARVPIRFAFDRTIAAELIGVALPYALASVVGAVLLNVDYLVIGNVVGTVGVGIYLLAFNVSSWPITIVGSSVRAAAIPGFAQMQAMPDEASRIFRRGFLLLAAGSVPFCAVLVSVPEAVLTFLYGVKWVGGAGALRFLGGLVLVRLLGGFVDDVLFAMGRSNWILFKNVLWLAALIPTMLFFVHRDGVRGAGLAQTLVALGLVLPLLILMANRLGVWTEGIALRLGALVPTFVVMVALGNWTSHLVDAPPLAVLAVTVPAQFAVFGLLAWRLRDWYLNSLPPAIRD